MWRLTITAHSFGEAMQIYDKVFEWDITKLIIGETPILKMAQAIMPTISWKIDDGEDKPSTSYCQYVWHSKEEGNKYDKYLLVHWSEIDEKGFEIW